MFKITIRIFAKLRFGNSLNNPNLHSYKINNVEENIAFLKEVLVIIQERVSYCQERENLSKSRKINANKEDTEYVKLVHSLVVDDQKNREDKWGKK
jgi:hypothetical protein